MAKMNEEQLQAAFNFDDEMPMVVNDRDLQGKRILLQTVDLEEGQNGHYFRCRCLVYPSGNIVMVNANPNSYFGKVAERIVTDQLDGNFVFDVKQYGKYTKLVYVGQAS